MEASTSINKDVIMAIEKNPPALYFGAVEIILKLIDNIIREPDNLKYRTIRMANKIIKEKLLTLSGMDNLLSEIGFEKTMTEFALPANTLTTKLPIIRDFIAKRKIIVQKKTQGTSTKTRVVRKKVPSRRRIPLTIIPSKPYAERIKYPKVLNTNNVFLDALERQSDQITQYEDAKLLKAGKRIIPIRKLEERAMQKLRIMQKAVKNGRLNFPEPCMKDLMLVELLNWFNLEYFDWVNSVRCKVCDNENVTRSIEFKNGIRIEKGFCCNTESQFHRFNCIEKLLITRKGRCGEYANCFTFFCRCLGYDARYAVATFDHVWTEVYSVSQKRWIHIDPSDNVFDAPLMYQHGWKRTIDYVFAYSADDIQDVTWRYTSNYQKTHQVRDLCSEKNLLSTILLVRAKRQALLSQTRKNYLNKRNVNELVQLMLPRPPTENEKRGRSSGSLIWRQERGEQTLNNFFVFRAIEVEIIMHEFNIRYSCTKNLYERFLFEGNRTKVINSYKGWETTQFEAKNLFRKVEKDWKMAYIARTEDASIGEILWKFDFRLQKQIIKSYKLKLDHKLYENGKVDIQVTDIVGNKKIEGSSGILIKVILSGGVGDIAWQHAQLFRQSLTSEDYPFILNVKFM